MIANDLVLFLTTKLASTESFVLVLLAISLYVMYQHSWQKGLLLICSTALLLISVMTLKLTFAIPRPDNALVEISSYAFPSGHAAGVMFMAITLEWFFRTVLQIKWLTLVRLGLVLLILAVGYSRLYLQVHTLEQVLAGFLVGGLVGVVFYLLLNIHKNYKKSSLQ